MDYLFQTIAMNMSAFLWSLGMKADHQAILTHFLETVLSLVLKLPHLIMHSIYMITQGH